MKNNSKTYESIRFIDQTPEEFLHDNFSYTDSNGNRRFNLSQETVYSVLQVLYAIKNAQETLYQLNKEFDIATYYDAQTLGTAIREYAHSAEYGAHYKHFARLYFSDPMFSLNNKKSPF